jgi:putative alpha-1,2-mannosidase
MSAWYVLAACGIYQICPGDTRYEITSPVFNRIEIPLNSTYTKGGTFAIIARNNSPENRYIQSARFNGIPLFRCFLNYSEIASGGTLELTMGNVPSKNWGF